MEQETGILLDQHVRVGLPVPRVLGIIRDKLLVELLLNILHHGLQARG